MWRSRRCTVVVVCCYRGKDPNPTDSIMISFKFKLKPFWVVCWSLLTKRPDKLIMKSAWRSQPEWCGKTRRATSKNKRVAAAIPLLVKLEPEVIRLPHNTPCIIDWVFMCNDFWIIYSLAKSHQLMPKCLELKLGLKSAGIDRLGDWKIHSIIQAQKNN